MAGGGRAGAGKRPAHRREHAGSDLSVAQYTAKVAKDLGGDIKIVKFTRFQKGEGLEKRADDFAAEVASMVK